MGAFYRVPNDLHGSYKRMSVRHRQNQKATRLQNANHFIQAVGRLIQIFQHVQAKTAVNARVRKRNAFNGGNKPECDAAGQVLGLSCAARRTPASPANRHIR